MYGHTRYFCPANKWHRAPTAGCPSLASAPQRLDLMRKMYNTISPQCLYRPLIGAYHLEYRISTCPALQCQTAELHISLFYEEMFTTSAFKMAHRPVHKISLLSEFFFFCVRARHCTWQLTRWRTATNSEGLEPWSVRSRCHFRCCRGNCCELQSRAD